MKVTKEEKEERVKAIEKEPKVLGASSKEQEDQRRSQPKKNKRC